MLNLTRRLLEAGLNVRRVYADVFIPGEKDDFEFLKRHYPDLEITPTLQVDMRFAAPLKEQLHTLAIGQKAAFFTGSVHFVDLVWGRGFYGHSGVAAIAQLMLEACRTPKKIQQVISHKGWGCESCL